MNRTTRKRITKLEKVVEKLQNYNTLKYEDRYVLEIAALHQAITLKVTNPTESGLLMTALRKMDKRRLLDETDRSVLVNAALAKVAEYKSGSSHVCRFTAADFTCDVCGETL